MDIKAVPIQEYWGNVEPQIRQIRDATPGVDYWVEDVYARCLLGESVLFMDMDEEPGDSFFVANVQTRLGEKILFLWIAFSAVPETAKETHQAIEDIAKQAGCVAVEFETATPKLADLAESLGYEMKLITLRKNL